MLDRKFLYSISNLIKSYESYQRRGDMVQVYGLGLEYGFISDSQRETHMRSPLPRPGVTLTTQGAFFR